MATLQDIKIPTKNKTFVIAEIGINHEGSIEAAKQLIDSAIRAGVDAVKFQTYKTEKRAKKDSPIFDILKKCELPLTAFKELKEYSEKQGALFFSTPFDEESVDYLESIGCQLYKLASFDVTNQPLIKKVASTGKAVIMSVGMSSEEEIRVAVEEITNINPNLSLLHCISSYPTIESDCNLGAVSQLKTMFPNMVIGQSDHTPGIKVPIYAVAAGAQIIEKHFKLTNVDCVDGPVSIDEAQMRDMIKEIRNVEIILGEGNVEITKVQKELLWLKRTVK